MLLLYHSTIIISLFWKINDAQIFITLQCEYPGIFHEVYFFLPKTWNMLLVMIHTVHTRSLPYGYGIDAPNGKTLFLLVEHQCSCIIVIILYNNNMKAIQSNCTCFLSNKFRREFFYVRCSCRCRALHHTPRLLCNLPPPNGKPSREIRAIMWW